MALWAYTCRLCNGDQQQFFVSQTAIDAMPGDVRIVRMQVGSQWLCAVVNRDRRIQVAGMLVREAVPSDEVECAECAKTLSTQTEASVGKETSVQDASAKDHEPSLPPQLAHQPGETKHVEKFLAATIFLQGDELIVALVSMDVLNSPGEAELVIAALQSRFRSLAVVLVAQDNAGLPTYYGNDDLVQRLAGIPLDELPWEEYPIS